MDTATREVPWQEPTHPDWRRLSARLCEWTETLTHRRDVLVKISPQTSGSTPAGLFNHCEATVTIDATRTLPGHPEPDRIDLRDARDRARFPVLAGVLAHEIGHATHSVRRPGLAGSAAEWAALLEEPRMEGRVVAGRPDSRRWLQASVAHLLGRAEPTNRLEAARMLVLIGGRGMAGVLDLEDLPDLDALTKDWLSAEQISVICEQTDNVVAASDGDIATLARAAQIISSLFESRIDDSATEFDDTGDAGCCAREGLDVDSAIGGALAAIAAKAATELRLAAGTVDPTPRAIAQKESARAREAQVVADYRQAREVEHRHELRRPTADEHRQAKILATQLSSASMRDVDVVRVPTTAPPGNLRTSQLVRRQAQIHTRVTPTAAPWNSTRRRTVRNPILKVGVALDISGSMEAYAQPTAVAAWMLARAVTDLQGRTATVTWNHQASLLPVRANNASVPVPMICGGSSGLPAALRVLERELALGGQSGARVLAIVTDGDLPNSDEVVAEVERLVDRGVHVLWLSSDDRQLIALPSKVTERVLQNPARIGSFLGEAAVQALRQA